MRNFHGLMPLLASCSTYCWLSGATSTEWKNYSLPRYNYVAWQFGSMPFSVFRSTMLGTRSLFASGQEQSEMSIRVRKSAQRLRISKFLTCDVLNAQLSEKSVSAMRRWSLFDFAIRVPRSYGKTSSLSSASVSSNPLWNAEGSDPIADLKKWKEEVRRDLYG